MRPRLSLTQVSSSLEPLSPSSPTQMPVLCGLLCVLLFQHWPRCSATLVSLLSPCNSGEVEKFFEGREQVLLNSASSQ